MEIQGKADYLVLEAQDLLVDVRLDGAQIIRKMVSVLDGNHVVVLDCGHPLGREHKGKFHMIQLESRMFTVVCDRCTGFAMMGEVIEGGGTPYMSGKV